MENVQTAIGAKMSTFFQQGATIIGGLIVAFIFSWKLTLVLVAIAPLIALAALIQAKLLQSGAARNSEAYQGANSLALEVISSIRVVASFVWETAAQTDFLERLMRTRSDRMKALHLTAVGSGFSLFCVFAVYSLGFWYGAQLVADTPANGGILLGDMLIVFFSVVIAAAAFGQLMSVLPDFARARVAGYNLLSVIERVPEIDSNDSGAVHNVHLNGEIEFDNVSFSFPSRQEQLVLNHLSLRIEPGSIVGVVGASGAGKSTIVSLLERFYDATSGVIRLDGVPIRDYNLRWLRSSIGLVSQEPRLFDQSVADNIRIGNPAASMEEVVAAAKAANAHTFITDLPQGYDTRVGEGGSQMSGGQKQRIAIARAVLKNPRIILLDEATSALDNESEAIVQEALDKLMQGRTTIVVAHRLSTIRNSTKIIVLEKGQLIESGSHDELLELEGLYFALVARQMDSRELADLRDNIRRRRLFSYDL